MSYNLEIRHLRCFLAVTEELNFTRAARRLNMAQPALSVCIKNIETGLGTRLFERDNRNVQLTEAGRILIAQARQMLAVHERTIDLTRRAAAGEIGSLSIAYTNPAGFLALPTLLPSYKRERPGVHLDFHDLRIPQQIEQLRRGELDIGFVWLPAPVENLEVHVLANEPYVVVLPADHPLAAEDAITITQLSNEPIVSVQRALDPISRSEIEQLFSQAGAALNISYELETLLSVLGFVAMGCGASLVPGYVRHISCAGVVYKPLRGAKLTKQLAIIIHKDASPLARNFFEFAAKTKLPSSPVSVHEN